MLSRIKLRDVTLVLLSCLYLANANANDLDSISSRNVSTWIKAISNDDVIQLQSMLSQNTQVELLLRETAPNGKTALMVACKKGDLTLAKALLDLGANVNTVTKTGGNAFMFAVLGNHLPIAKWLASKDADISAGGSNGWTAVTIAAAMGHTDTLDWLTTLEAPLDRPDVYRFTPFMRAVDNGHVEAARLLLDTSDVDVNAADEWQNTALHFVMANKNKTLLELLLQRGALVDKANRDGVTPRSMMSQWPEAQKVVDRLQ